MSTATESFATEIRATGMVSAVEALAKFYNNPYRTVAIEYTTNMLDEHRQSGQTRPAEVTAEYTDDHRLILTFTDFGRGMDRQRLIDVYAHFDDSEKKADENSVGGFGTGAKSGLSLTDQITVISRRECAETLLTMRTDPEVGIANTVSVPMSPLREDDGTTVKITVTAADHGDFSADTVPALAALSAAARGGLKVTIIDALARKRGEADIVLAGCNLEGASADLQGVLGDRGAVLDDDHYRLLEPAPGMVTLKGGPYFTGNRVHLPTRMVLPAVTWNPEKMTVPRSRETITGLTQQDCPAASTDELTYAIKTLISQRFDQAQAENPDDPEAAALAVAEYLAPLRGDAADSQMEKIADEAAYVFSSNLSDAGDTFFFVAEDGRPTRADMDADTVGQVLGAEVRYQSSVTLSGRRTVRQVGRYSSPSLTLIVTPDGKELSGYTSLQVRTVAAYLSGARHVVGTVVAVSESHQYRLRMVTALLRQFQTRGGVPQPPVTVIDVDPDAPEVTAFAASTERLWDGDLITADPDDPEGVIYEPVSLPLREWRESMAGGAWVFLKQNAHRNDGIAGRLPQMDQVTSTFIEHHYGREVTWQIRRTTPLRYLVDAAPGGEILVFDGGASTSVGKSIQAHENTGLDSALAAMTERLSDGMAPPTTTAARRSVAVRALGADPAFGVATAMLGYCEKVGVPVPEGLGDDLDAALRIRAAYRKNNLLSGGYDYRHNSMGAGRAEVTFSIENPQGADSRVASLEKSVTALSEHFAGLTGDDHHRTAVERHLRMVAGDMALLREMGAIPAPVDYAALEADLPELVAEVRVSNAKSHLAYTETQRDRKESERDNQAERLAAMRENGTTESLIESVESGLAVRESEVADAQAAVEDARQRLALAEEIAARYA